MALSERAVKLHLAGALACLIVAAWVSGCGGGSPTTPTSTTQAQPPSNGSTSGGPAVTVEAADETIFSGAGDIADIKYLSNAYATAELLRMLPGPKFTAGDNVQDSGTMREYLEWWKPTWGSMDREIYPTIGNHDKTSAYYDYFGARAGPYGLGYYSYDLGRSWHVLSLNSNDGSAVAGSQYAWVANDLATSTRPCTIAIWHHPTVSSGENTDEKTMENVRTLFYAAGGEIVINGHNHIYERMLPSDASYRRDDRHGLVQFVVGTGGYALYSMPKIAPNSAFRFNQDHGVLSLTLGAGTYAWQFITVKGGVVDSGSGTCHGAPGPKVP